LRLLYLQNTELPDKELIKNLNYIIENTGAKCILSSTWRYSYGYFALDTILYLLGAMPEILIGQTKGDRATRGREIEHWLKGKHIESFVVLDDETDIAPYMDNLVRVDSKVGLTKYDAERAIKILNGDINDT